LTSILAHEVEIAPHPVLQNIASFDAVIAKEML